MVAPSNTQNFPGQTAPLVVQGTDRVSYAWYQFFLTLWKRTGGSTGLAVTMPGTVAFWVGPEANPPSGWLTCDGSAVSRVTYSDLFNAIGTLWGPGDLSTTFNLPNLTSNSIQGPYPDAVATLMIKT